MVQAAPEDRQPWTCLWPLAPLLSRRGMPLGVPSPAGVEGQIVPVFLSSLILSLSPTPLPSTSLPSIPYLCPPSLLRAQYVPDSPSSPPLMWGQPDPAGSTYCPSTRACSPIRLEESSGVLRSPSHGPRYIPPCQHATQPPHLPEGGPLKVPPTGGRRPGSFPTPPSIPLLSTIRLALQSRRASFS